MHSSIPLWQQPLHFWVHKTFARSFNTADLYFSMKRRLKDTRHDKNLRIPYLLQRLPIVNKKSRSHVCTILLIRILEISDWDIWPLISYLGIWSKTITPCWSPLIFFNIHFGIFFSAHWNFFSVLSLELKKKFSEHWKKISVTL